MRETTFVCSYRFDGAEHGFEVVARDAVEARERMKAMALGRVDGELMAKIPAPDAGLTSGIIPRFLCWWNNSR